MLPVLFVVGIFLWLYCIIDVITTDEIVMRNLPKIVWLLIVLFFPTVGSIVWLVAGRPVGKSFSLGGPTVGNRQPTRSSGPPPAGLEDSPEYRSRVEEERLRRWEDELRRREDELRRREEDGPT